MSYVLYGTLNGVAGLLGNGGGLEMSLAFIVYLNAFALMGYFFHVR